MTLGNRIGVTLNDSIAVDDLFTPAYGSFIIELADNAKLPAVSNLVEIGEIGTTTSEYAFKPPVRRWTWTPCRKLGSPASNPCSRTAPRARIRRDRRDHRLPRTEEDRVHGFFRCQAARGDPGVPGQQLRVRFRRRLRARRCRRDHTDRQQPDAGRRRRIHAGTGQGNQQEPDRDDSGRFSGGDEPDGSAKFITAFFRAPAVTEAVRDLLKNRDGLMLGICNGFQALVKLGLVPYGDIVPMTDAARR